MKCPFCGSDDTQVVDTRANLEANTVRRRRKCVTCEKRFTTYERVDLKMPRLVKKDGSRTDFDRDKIMGSMMLALRKRPVSTEDVDEAVDRVIERLRALGEREVPTNRVGDFVMRELAKLDKIAYIRFASVYRSFETPDDFREAVQEVKAGKVEFRTDKTALVHVPVGKISFTPDKLVDNATTLITSIIKAKPSVAKGKYVKGCYLSSTMGPGISLDVSALETAAKA